MLLRILLIVITFFTNYLVRYITKNKETEWTMFIEGTSTGFSITSIIMLLTFFNMNEVFVVVPMCNMLSIILVSFTIQDVIHLIKFVILETIRYTL